MARLATTGVDDAAPRMPTLQPERQLAVLIEIESDPALAQFPDRVRGLLDQDLDGGRAAEPPASRDRVGRVLGGGVAWLQRRGQASLRPEAGALGERRARNYAGSRALLRCP